MLDFAATCCQSRRATGVATRVRFGKPGVRFDIDQGSALADGTASKLREPDPTQCRSVVPAPGRSPGSGSRRRWRRVGSGVGSGSTLIKAMRDQSALPRTCTNLTPRNAAACRQRRAEARPQAGSNHIGEDQARSWKPGVRFGIDQGNARQAGTAPTLREPDPTRRRSVAPASGRSPGPGSRLLRSNCRCRSPLLQIGRQPSLPHLQTSHRISHWQFRRPAPSHCPRHAA
jgi:hypothetical protein